MLLTGAAAAEAKITLKVANSGPDTLENRTVCAADVYTDMVKKATNGEVELVFYHASKLGGEAEALEGIQMGTIDMGTLTSGPASNFFPQTMAFDIPYLISSNAAGWEFLKSDFVKKLSDEFCKKTGVRILAIAEHGYRHFTAKGGDLKTPADMKGLKVRVMENPAHMAMTRGLGATPTPIPYSELYMALQQGVVGGAAPFGRVGGDSRQICEQFVQQCVTLHGGQGGGHLNQLPLQVVPTTEQFILLHVVGQANFHDALPAAVGVDGHGDIRVVQGGGGDGEVGLANQGGNEGLVAVEIADVQHLFPVKGGQGRTQLAADGGDAGGVGNGGDLIPAAAVGDLDLGLGVGD